MGRLLAVSFRPYRRHQLELRDTGRECRVIIHPPGGHGSPHEVTAEREGTTLAELIARAKAMVDVVMGPKPAPRAWQPRPREY